MKCSVVFLVLVPLLVPSESLVISPRWEHLRWKTVSPVLIVVRSGGEVTLSCSATGSPAPSIAWYKDGLFVPHLELEEEEEEKEEGHSLGETVARLRVSCMTEFKVGKYECRARAGHQELSVVTELRLADWDGDDMCRETGEPEVGVWSPTLMVEEGHSALLRCRAMESGLEKVKTVWRDEEGRELGQGERVSVTVAGDLVIRDVSFTDMGTYACSLANSRGENSVSTFLYPLAPSTDTR